jgi:hypothetical protein
MGADYTAKAVIGCILDYDKIPIIRKKVKAFKHDIPETSDVKFDAKTGRPLWEEHSYPAFTFNEEDRGTETKKINKKGLKIYQGTDGEPTILGFGVSDTYSNGGNTYDFATLPNIPALKEKLKSILEPLNMWNEKEFGLYALLDCSY